MWHPYIGRAKTGVVNRLPLTRNRLLNGASRSFLAPFRRAASARKHTKAGQLGMLLSRRQECTLSVSAGARVYSRVRFLSAGLRGSPHLLAHKMPPRRANCQTNSSHRANSSHREGYSLKYRSLLTPFLKLETRTDCWHERGSPEIQRKLRILQHATESVKVRTPAAISALIGRTSKRQ